MPYPDRLPNRLVWCVHTFIVLGMVILNLLTIYSIRALVTAKFWMMQLAIDAQGVWMGIVVLVLVSVFFAFACLGVIFRLAPGAAGSGAPETKGWLNGAQEMASIFTWRNMIVRAVATVFSNACGFPVGREGPTVTMGGNFAFRIFDFVSFRYVRRRIRALSDAERMRVALDCSEDLQVASIVSQERFKANHRIACAVGGACGMTMIFDSPIGGIIYMFEEIGAISWEADMTFSAVGATVLCTVLTKLLLEWGLGSDLKEWVIYQVDFDALLGVSKSWFWNDLPFFLLLALFLGPFSALHTRLCLAVGNIRQQVMGKIRCQPFGKMIDGLLFAAVCSLVATLVAQLGGCDKTTVNLKEADLKLVRFTCEHEDEYNPVASLLVTTSEAAIKLLYSRQDANVKFFAVSDLMLAFLAYTFLNIGLTGIPAPSGNFTGTMLIGGFVGRALGNELRDSFPGRDYAKPGVYAMMGSAAMLCGFKRMSMAVVLFIAECGDDWNLIPPLMMCVFVSLSLCKKIQPSGFDEEQMARRGIAFLEPEPHRTLYGHVASELVDASIVCLPLQAPSEDLRRLCASSRALHFPVLRDDSLCVGFITRQNLEAALARHCERAGLRAGPGGGGGGGEALGGNMLSFLGGGSMSLEYLVDRSPHKVDELMPAPRVYALFAKAGISYACVVSERGDFRGAITRSSLSKAARRLHEH